MLNNLKLKFDGLEKINKNYSQANQDLFVLSCLNGKKNGKFLDLGCNDPINISNTYLLEKEFNWTGIAVDIDQNHINNFTGKRNCQAICQDCTKINYIELLSGLDHIDYLSLDLEPASITLECLKQIPLDKIEFSIITFEHDFYRFGDYYRSASREIFKKNGYYLLCSNVDNADDLKEVGKFIYEDWYINPKYIDINRVKMLECESLDHRQILFNL